MHYVCMYYVYIYVLCIYRWVGCVCVRACRARARLITHAFVFVEVFAFHTLVYITSKLQLFLSVLIGRWMATKCIQCVRPSSSHTFL